METGKRNLFFVKRYYSLNMTKHLNHIGKQLTIFALIASIFNIYALEIWCGLAMGHHAQEVGVESHMAMDHSSEGKENCPHQSDGTEGSCEDHHNFFITTTSESAAQKFILDSGDFNFTRPDHFSLTVARPFSQATLPVKLFPDEGLKPKVPDIRIFICSLTI